MRPHILPLGRLFAGIIVVTLAVVIEHQARAGSIVVSNSAAHTSRLYDLDAGTATTAYANGYASVGTVAIDSLADDIYTSVLQNSYYHDIFQYDLATGAGPIDLTMTALVPEPATWLLLSLALSACPGTRLITCFRDRDGMSGEKIYVANETSSRRTVTHSRDYVI